MCFISVFKSPPRTTVFGLRTGNTNYYHHHVRQVIVSGHVFVENLQFFLQSNRYRLIYRKVHYGITLELNINCRTLSANYIQVSRYTYLQKQIHIDSTIQAPCIELLTSMNMLQARKIYNSNSCTIKSQTKRILLCLHLTVSAGCSVTEYHVIQSPRIASRSMMPTSSSEPKTCHSSRTKSHPRCHSSQDTESNDSIAMHE